MKKKIASSKTLVIGGMSLLCVAILAGVLIWTSQKPPEFQPDPSSDVTTNSTWEEHGSSGSAGDAGATESQPIESADQREEYPKVTSETEKEVVIDFTPEASKPETPPPPKASGGNADNSVPSAPPAVGSCVSETPKEKPPEGKPGQVYDPVFGWTDISPAQGEEANGSGDPNKIVGSMD